MRIIGGHLKGRKIFLPNDKHTRPLRDMVKESIFNLIEHSKKFNIEVKDCSILDLFSGSGSFGLECISRGARKVIFIENYFQTLKILNKNILNLKVQNNVRVIEKDCFEFLKEILDHEEKFKIIFIDPPYKEEKVNLLIDLIKVKKILNKDGIIIIHRHKLDNVKISEKLQILDIRTYGI